MKLLAAVLPLLGPAVVTASLSLELTRANGDESTPALSKRSTFVESLANNITGGAYYIDVKVGTPGQDSRMILDTGSSDAWVVSSRADFCNSKKLQTWYGDSCSSTYDSTKSSTYSLKQRSGFEIQYLDGTTARGDYVKDDFSIGSTTVKSLQIGVATTTVRGTGILGVGFSAHVSAQEQYPNLMDELVSQKIIESKAFSLWLNDRRSPSGRILFGGIDTAKFIGALKVVPIIPDVFTKNVSSFTVGLSGFEVEFSNGVKETLDLSSSSSSSNPTLLDSGTTLSYLPAAVANKVYSMFGAVEDTNGTALTYISCSYLEKEENMTMAFTFDKDGGTIKVPVYEMVLDVVRNIEGFTPPTLPFDDVCLFGIQSTAQFIQQYSSLDAQNFVLLGDTFLRSAYVVYDLQHKEIGIAQANLNATDSKVVNLTASETSLPRLTGVAGQVANTAGPTVLTTITGADGKPTVTAVDASATSDSAAAGRLATTAIGKEVTLLVAVWGVFALFGGVFFVL